VTSDAQRALLDSPGLYLTGEDNLRVTTFGGVAGVTVVMEGRLVTPDGRIVPLAERHIPNSNYTAATSIFGLAEGTLTNVQLRASSAGVLGGGVFAILEIVRGGGTNAQALGTLLQGYVTTNARLAWPGSPILPSTAGAGRLRSITGTDPAAGVEISETVPTGVRWRVISFTATLVTDATVANRIPRLQVDDGANVVATVTSTVGQTASVTAAWSWADWGAIPTSLTNANMQPLPANLWLPPGYRIRTLTAAIVAGDNWGAPQYLVEEFIE
jgi:hypothetical protein